jgi:hypothetical protein
MPCSRKFVFIGYYGVSISEVIIQYLCITDFDSGAAPFDRAVRFRLDQSRPAEGALDCSDDIFRPHCYS